MRGKKSLRNSNIIYTDLKSAKELVYDPCGYDLKNLTIHSEGSAYSACSYELEGKIIEYRAAKITPLKSGQFVTIWRRNNKGITRPFDSSDEMDFIIISSVKDDDFGLFIFPKSALLSKGIISQNGEGGKRGIRVYPPWDMVSNKQAENTQSWQKKYFVWVNDHSQSYLYLTKTLFQ
jgi:hypothetical protein